MNLNKYFKHPRKFKRKIIVISIKDEASRYIKNFKSKRKLGLKMDIKYRDSYVAVIDHKKRFLYENCSHNKIDCAYQVNDKFIDIISAGYDCGNKSSIKVGEKEYSSNRRGINIAIFKSKSLKCVDILYCDSFGDKELNVCHLKDKI